MTDIKHFGDANTSKIFKMAAQCLCDNSYVSLCCAEWLHLQNFHGVKRVEKCFSKKYYKYKMKLLFHSLNLFSEKIETKSSDSFATPKDLRGCLEALLEFKIKSYTDISAMAFELDKSGLSVESDMVKKADGCLNDEIKCIRRMINDGNLCEWDYSHLRIIDQTRHDKEKKRH